ADEWQRAPPRTRSIVGEYILGLARAVEAQVATGAPEAEGSGDERIRVALRDPLGRHDAAAELTAAHALHLGGDVGDGSDQDQPRHAPIPGLGDVMERLVGPGRVPGEDDGPIARFAREPDHRADVLHAVAEALEGGADQLPSVTGDDVVPARV